MPEKVTASISKLLQDIFPENKVDTVNRISKVHVDELTGEDIESLYTIIMEDTKYQSLQIKRSGTGLTIIVGEQNN